MYNLQFLLGLQETSVLIYNIDSFDYFSLEGFQLILVGSILKYRLAKLPQHTIKCSGAMKQ